MDLNLVVKLATKSIPSECAYNLHTPMTAWRVPQARYAERRSSRFSWSEVISAPTEPMPNDRCLYCDVELEKGTFRAKESK